MGIRGACHCAGMELTQFTALRIEHELDAQSDFHVDVVLCIVDNAKLNYVLNYTKCNEFGTYRRTVSVHF